MLTAVCGTLCAQQDSANEQPQHIESASAAMPPALAMHPLKRLAVCALNPLVREARRLCSLLVTNPDVRREAVTVLTCAQKFWPVLLSGLAAWAAHYAFSGPKHVCIREGIAQEDEEVLHDSNRQHSRVRERMEADEQAIQEPHDSTQFQDSWPQANEAAVVVPSLVQEQQGVPQYIPVPEPSFEPAVISADIVEAEIAEAHMNEVAEVVPPPPAQEQAQEQPLHQDLPPLEPSPISAELSPAASASPVAPLSASPALSNVAASEPICPHCRDESPEPSPQCLLAPEEGLHNMDAFGNIESEPEDSDAEQDEAHEDESQAGADDVSEDMTAVDGLAAENPYSELALAGAHVGIIDEDDEKDEQEEEDNDVVMTDVVGAVANAQVGSSIRPGGASDDEGGDDSPIEMPAAPSSQHHATREGQQQHAEEQDDVGGHDGGYGADESDEQHASSAEDEKEVIDLRTPEPTSAQDDADVDESDAQHDETHGSASEDHSAPRSPVQRRKKSRAERVRDSMATRTRVDLHRSKAIRLAAALKQLMPYKEEPMPHLEPAHAHQRDGPERARSSSPRTSGHKRKRRSSVESQTEEDGDEAADKHGAAAAPNLDSTVPPSRKRAHSQESLPARSLRIDTSNNDTGAAAGRASQQDSKPLADAEDSSAHKHFLRSHVVGGDAASSGSASARSARSEDGGPGPAAASDGAHFTRRFRRESMHAPLSTTDFLNAYIDANGITLHTVWNGDRLGALENAALQRCGVGNTVTLIEEINKLLRARTRRASL